MAAKHFTSTQYKKIMNGDVKVNEVTTGRLLHESSKSKF